MKTAWIAASRQPDGRTKLQLVYAPTYEEARSKAYQIMPAGNIHKGVMGYWDWIRMDGQWDNPDAWQMKVRDEFGVMCWKYPY